jgi:hypothetical protein
MTGLNLEGFLHLLRADLGAWATLGLIALVLALMAWTSWGSRRALRKCLVLSVVAHFGLALYGGTVPVVLHALRPDDPDSRKRERISQIKVVPTVAHDDRTGNGTDRQGRGSFAAWDKPLGGLALADAKLKAPRTADPGELVVRPGERTELKAEAAAPEADIPAPPTPESRPKNDGAAIVDTSPMPPKIIPGAEGDIAPVEVMTSVRADTGLTSGAADLRARARPESSAVGAAASMPPIAMTRPPAPELSRDEAGRPLADRPLVGTGSEPAGHGSTAASRPAAAGEGDAAAPGVVKVPVAPLPRLAPPESDVRRRSRPPSPANPNATAADLAGRRPVTRDPLALARVTPSGVPALPEIQGATGGRPLADVPEVYRSRLDPNRSALAFRTGASRESEQAVERALDWLARHQDTDGRWDGATAKYDDGTAVKGDDDFTVHCPPGETCFGECIYWEADSALTGLALLSYLGAGYTQTDGKYAETVGKGLDFLLSTQKPDGDLRGRSRAVGMYCHAMATIALCEAYAMTGDERLRPAVERAVAFLVKSRARDGLAWRYSPGAAVGDTSILGWVVMALKSAKEVGIAVPSTAQSGTLGWLANVSSGESRGLARYQPQDNVTPTMTAEAWVCRQFLGTGGPGAASTEAAEYLLIHGPSSDQYNLYYWYYGTLAMYQHGGDAWYRWNGQVRDEIVRRQRVLGHPAGSWDPDDSPYGAKGGRIYCTALATLSLEVYYRYLRLYDEPKIPPAVAPARPRGDRDPALGRR